MSPTLLHRIRNHPSPIIVGSCAKTKKSRRRGRVGCTLLRYLHQQQRESLRGHTPMLSRRQVAADTGLNMASVPKSISRLREAGLVDRVSHRSGCRGGTSYRLTLAGKALLESLEESDEEHAEVAPPSERPERDRAPNTRPERLPQKDPKMLTWPKKMALHCKQTGIAAFGVGANDLLPLWHHGVFESENSLRESLEHLAWYLRNERSKGIHSPKAWAMKQLRSGYYAEPAGFMSQAEALAQAEERQRLIKAERRAEASERLQQAAAERANQQAAQHFDAAFTAWVQKGHHQRFATEWNHPNGFMMASGPAKTALLKSIFAREKGLKMPR